MHLQGHARRLLLTRSGRLAGLVCLPDLLLATMKLTIAFLLVSGAIAACPNACSNHGECGAYDSCTCHKGFQGGDCSERVCMYNWAWVTTANGDLNFDSDRYDGTVYSETTRIDATVANTPTVGFGGQVLLTQANPD